MVSMERILIAACILGFAINAAKADDILNKAPGRAPGKGLKMKSSKVPSFEIHKAGPSIPRLDIGEEAVLTFQAPRAPASNAAGAPNLKPVQKQASPAAVVFDAKKSGVAAAAPAKNLGIKESSVPDVKPLKEIADPQPKATQIDEVKIQPFSGPEGKLLEAQILLERLDNPEVALGLLVEILDDKTVQTEARYTYALAARKLGLNSEFRSVLFKIAQEGKSKEWGRLAAESLAREVEALDISDMKVLHDLVEKYDVDTEKNDAYNFYRAKYFLETGDLGQVEAALANIPEKSKYRADARLIAALASYRTGKIDRAASELTELLKESSREQGIRSTGAITLARIQFQKGQYKEAYQTYLQVDKSNPLWLSAMVEQAWAQIMTQDYEGAAGNMFSLHTDFFKHAFSPESYTVRSVAYLNLCQYGDGMQALNNFKHKYGPLVNRVETYRKEKKSPQDDYETVRAWLKNSDLKEIAGLPRSFIIELARHPSFMKTQQQINNFEDEMEAFNKATLTLIQFEKDSVRKQSEGQAELAKIRAQKETAGADRKVRIDALERRIAGLKAQYELAKKARGLIKDARSRSLARIDKEKVGLKEKASKALRSRLNELSKELTQALEQNEVLQYEILAGAGEHLRAQSAGAAVNDKKRDELKPEEGKNVKWNFQGEIWEDEIGHYRSSLKNVCSKDDKVASY